MAGVGSTIVSAVGSASGQSGSGAAATSIVSATGTACGVGEASATGFVITLVVIPIVPKNLEELSTLSFFDVIGLSSGIGAGG